MRFRCRPLPYLLVLLGIALPVVAHAQWGPDGAALCTDLNDQTDPKAIADGLGGAVVVWADARTAPYTFDVYAQRVTSFGQPQWTANGVAVSVASGNQVSPVIARDGAGGAIMAWEDNRGANSDIYVQRINAAGVAQWAANGIPVCTAAGDQFAPRIVSDGAGGAIVCWEDLRAGTNSDIYACRVNAFGAVLWTANGVGVSATPDDQLVPNMTSDGFNGAIVTWYDARGDEPFDIYAQRVDSSGVALWTAGGVAVNDELDSQEEPEIVADGTGGAIVTWLDYRTNGFNSDLYAQRLNPNGTRRWLAAGVPVSAASGDQMTAAIAPDGAGGAVVTWEDLRANRPRVFAQRLNAAGNVRWAVNGVELAPGTPGSQIAPAIVSPSPGSAIVAWTDLRKSLFNSDAFAQRIDSTGVAQWVANGVELSGAGGDQLSPTMALGSGGVIVAWEDGRNGFGSDIYGQGVTLAGAVGPTVDVTGDTPVVFGITAPRPNPSRGGATFQLALPTAQRVTADVFSIDGRRVRSLADGAAFAAGVHPLAWDGRDSAGSRVKSGIYLVRVHASGGSLTTKVTMLD